MYQITIPSKYVDLFQRQNLRIAFDEKTASKYNCEFLIPGNKLLLNIITICSNKGSVTIKHNIDDKISLLRYYFAINFSGKKDMSIMDYVDVKVNLDASRYADAENKQSDSGESKKITESYMTALKKIQEKYNDERSKFLDDANKRYASDLDLFVNQYDSRIRELDNAINLRESRSNDSSSSQEFRFKTVEEIEGLEKTKHSMIKTIQENHQVTLEYSLVACQINPPVSGNTFINKSQMVPVEDKFEHIPLDKIKVQKNNVRTRDIDQGVEDLAENIRANGLLQPIAAYLESDGGYVILTGQRRLNAYNYLNDKYSGQGFDKILCKIIPEPKDDNKKKALSLAENITQLPMTNTDLIKSVTDLYNVYNDEELVQQEFGISKTMVRKYVKLSRLPDQLKAAIQEGEIHADPKRAENVALRAVDALGFTKNGDTPVSDVVDMAKAIAQGEISGVDAVNEGKRGGSASQIIDRSKKKPKTKLNIDLSTDTAEKLDRVADSNGEDRKMRATQYVVDGVDKDYKDLGD